MEIRKNYYFYLGLPPRLSKKELVEALNRLYSYEQLDEMQSELLKT